MSSQTETMTLATPEVETMETNKTAGPTPAQYKMHYYAIYTLQHFQNLGIVSADFDPLSLDIQNIMDYNPAKFASHIKNKNKNSIVRSPKPNIIQSIVDGHSNPNGVESDSVKPAKKSKKTAAEGEDAPVKKPKKSKKTSESNPDETPAEKPVKTVKKKKSATEPATSDPVASTSEPATSDPVASASEPSASEPVKKTVKKNKKTSVSEPNAEETPAEKPVKTVKKKKAATEPIASEPIASEPVASEPIASEPIASEPIASEPIASEPIASEPIASEPVAKKTVKKTKKTALPEIVNEIVNASTSTLPLPPKDESPPPPLPPKDEELEEGEIKETDEEFEEKEIQVSVTYIQDVKYLIDSDKNLYDPETFEPVVL